MSYRCDLPLRCLDWYLLKLTEKARQIRTYPKKYNVQYLITYRAVSIWGINARWNSTFKNDIYYLVVNVSDKFEKNICLNRTCLATPNVKISQCFRHHQHHLSPLSPTAGYRPPAAPAKLFDSVRVWSRFCPRLILCHRLSALLDVPDFFGLLLATTSSSSYCCLASCPG